MLSRSAAILSVVLSLVVCVCVAPAQTFRGSIQGTITDTSGAAIPGAQVKVSSPDTGLSRIVPANDEPMRGL